MAEEGCKVAYLKRKRRYNSYKGEISDAPPQPGGAQLPRGRTEQAVAHRHHRVQAAQRGEGVPQPGHRLLRRPRRLVAHREAPERGPRQRLAGGRRLKNEFFYHRDWDGVTVESFMELLDGYIRFYNERRKKQSLGWMSPMQYRISKGLAA